MPLKGSYKVPGQLVPGNIDLSRRTGANPGDPIVHNPNGSTSTVYSGSFPDQNGREVLVPYVIPDGNGGWKIGAPEEARSQYERTGQHLGIFDHYSNADAYAQYLHEDLANQMGLGRVAKAPIRDESMNTRMNAGVQDMVARVKKLRGK